jgi:hypothetical protein
MGRGPPQPFLTPQACASKRTQSLATGATLSTLAHDAIPVQCTAVNPVICAMCTFGLVPHTPDPANPLGTRYPTPSRGRPRLFLASPP